MSEINWHDDEAVVRAAVPDMQINYGDGSVPYELFTETEITRDSYARGWFHSLYEAWPIARQHPNVQAYERAHNPAFQSVAQVEAPQPGEKVTWRIDQEGFPDRWTPVMYESLHGEREEAERVLERRSKYLTIRLVKIVTVETVVEVRRRSEQ